MKGKRQLKWWQMVVAFLLLVLVCAFGVYLYIPTYIEDNLLPKVSKELGTTIEASVRRFDLSGADLENIVLTNDDGKLQVDSIRVDYKLKDLLHGHLAGVTISGADLNVSVKESRKLVIAGIDLEALQHRKTSQKKATPWAIDEVALKNCNLNLSYHHIAVRIPFHAVAKSLSNKLDHCIASGQIYPFGQKLACSASLDSGANKLKCQVQLPHFNTLFLEDLVSPQNRPELTADVSLTSNFNLTLKPLSFDQGSLEVKSSNLKYKNQQIGLSLSPKTSQPSAIKVTGQNSSFHIDLQGLHISAPTEATVTATPTLTIDGDLLKVVGNVGVTLPKNLHIKQTPEQLILNYHATINKKTKNWQLKVNAELENNSSRTIIFGHRRLSLPDLTVLIEAKGNLDTAKINYNLHSKQFSYQVQKFSVGGNKLNISGQLDYKKAHISGQFQLICDTLNGRFPLLMTHQPGKFLVGASNLKVSGKLKDIKDVPSGQFNLTCDTFSSSLLTPTTRQSGKFSVVGQKLKVSGKLNHTSGQCTVSCDTLDGTLPEGKIKLTGCKVNDMFKLGTVGSWLNATHQLELNTTHGTASYRKVKGEVEDLKCELAIDRFDKITGVVNVHKFNSSYPPQKVTTTGELHVPFSWPFAPSDQEGIIKLEEITYNGKDLGALTLKTAQRDDYYKLSGALHPSLLAGEMVQLSAEIDQTLSKATLDYKLNKMKIENLRKLDTLFDTNTDIDLNGWLSCHGQVFYQNGAFDASTDLALNDANIILSAEGDKLEGVNLWLAFPSLMKMKSKPKQYFSFDKAHVGKLKLGKSLIEFQLEAKDQFFLEKCDFSWCGGKLFSHALRFNPLDATMNMMLFCKDIQLNALAEDFYDMDLETTAMLSGSIPLLIKDDQLYFKRGLLYTVPGKLGKIKVLTENILTKSLTKSMPQYGKLSFVENAMKDFNYDWVKFLVRTDDSTKRTLQASLSFFGKPSKKLKFNDNGTAKLYDPLKSPPLVPQINVNIDYKLFDIYKRYKKVISIFN